MTRHAPTNTTRIRQRRRGFTIVELLVAVSLLALMLFLIDNLFNSTTRAVSDGVRQSAVLANARAVQSRLTIDASAMLGPDSANTAPEGGGYIIIVNRQIQSQVLRRDGSESLETFRVDQLIFVASTTETTSNIREFRASAPRNADQYGSDFASQHALVRYGHGRRVNRDGSDLGGWVELGFDRNSGLDRLANDWILSRQTILFNPTDTAGNFITPGVDWHTQVPFFNTAVIAPNPQPGITRAAAEGYCDVVNADASVFVDNYLNPADPLSIGFSQADIDSAYMFMTGADQRLRVNPIPAASGTDFPAWQIGQLHGVFAPNCSDFIVQFAADVDNDGEIDRFADGSVIWYDRDTIGLLPVEWDASSASGDDNAPWLPFAYLGSLNPPPTFSFASALGYQTHADTAFIFRMEDDQSFNTAGDPDNSKWPYMIRIRYRLHDAPGRLESNASFRRADGFSNDDDNNDGTVNGAGDIADEEDEAIVSGRYFEQIIRVPRP